MLVHSFWILQLLKLYNIQQLSFLFSELYVTSFFVKISRYLALSVSGLILLISCIYTIPNIPTFCCYLQAQYIVSVFINSLPYRNQFGLPYWLCLALGFVQVQLRNHLLSDQTQGHIWISTQLKITIVNPRASRADPQSNSDLSQGSNNCSLPQAK